MSPPLRSPVTAIACAVCLGGLFGPRLGAQGIPEPSLVLYGAVYNNVGGVRVRWNIGTLTWRFKSAAETVTTTTTLTNVNDQFSYVMLVPCETVIPGIPPGVNTLKLAGTSYDRTDLGLVMPDGTAVPVRLLPPASANLTMGTADRGKLEQVDLEISYASQDTDHDGLPDDWEIYYFGTLAYGPGDDPDGDGVSNLSEYLAGTSPNTRETGVTPGAWRKGGEG